MLRAAWKIEKVKKNVNININNVNANSSNNNNIKEDLSYQ